MAQDGARPRLALSPLRVPRTSEFVAQRLRESILLGELPEGSLLPSEKDMVAQLGVSRATVREALRLLEAQGIVETRPGRGGGARICRPTPASLTRSLALLLQFDRTSLADLLEARRAIEPLCARLAAVRAGARDLAVLDDAIQDMRKHVDDSDLYLMAQARFHLQIAQASRNDVLRLFATSLRELVFEQIRQVPFTPEDRRAGIEASVTILEAISRHDPDAAYRRTERHLVAVEEAIARVAGEGGLRND